MNTPKSARILVVDDTPTNIEVLLGILEDDYAVGFATSGPQTLDLLARGPRPDLILLDVMMPVMDGFAICAALKADPTTRDIPVIFVTAKTDVHSETQALNGGGVDFIHKPVNGALVRARVRLHLELQRRTRELEKSLTDQFKQVNDTWGHAVGDQLLQAAARRLSGSVRSSDTVGRIGGDEFVVLLNEVADEGDAARVAAGIRRVLGQSYVIAGQTLDVSASVGIAVYPDHGHDAIMLARQADHAMYLDKAAGAGR